MRFQPLYLLAMKDNLTFSGMIYPGYAIKDCGLSGAIWPDEACNLTLFYYQVNIVNSSKPAKYFGKVFGLKEHRKKQSKVLSQESKVLNLF